MTEPSGGSDVQSIKTRAVKEGNSYRLSGQKTFITNGQHANLIIVAAKTIQVRAQKARHWWLLKPMARKDSPAVATLTKSV